MRFTLTLTCVASVIIAVCSTNPEETNFNNHNRQRDHILEPLNVAADRETIAYLLPRLAAKYKPNEEWSEVMDPRFYVLSEMDNDVLDDQIIEQARRKKYNFEQSLPRQIRYYGSGDSPVLSINAPIQSLRNLYAKERLRQRIRANQDFLAALVDSQ